jgi:hypothetical protein
VLTQVWEVIKFITNHQKPLALYRQVGARTSRTGPIELLKCAETRFASKIMMIMRFKDVHDILEKLMVDDEYTAWLDKQKTDTHQKGREIKSIVRDDPLLKSIALCIKIMEPCLCLLRLTDGTKGANLSNVYAKMLELDVLYRDEIEGISERASKKIHAIFMTRCDYFHTPVMTAAYRLAPEYCRFKHDDDAVSEMDKEIKEVFSRMANKEHPYGAYEVALAAGTHDLTDDIAFSKHAEKMPPYQWANTYLRAWPHLKYCATRLLSLSCSASACEHSWSIEGWMHSKKGNCMGQGTVERLVRTHTNLLLEAQFQSEADAVTLP